MIWLSIVSAITGFIFYIKKTRAFIMNFFLKIFGRESKQTPAVTEKSSVEAESKAEVR